MSDNFHITQEGLDDLVSELENRKSEVRTSIANAIELAREQGDLSENASYKAAMEDKEFNENRLSKLEDMVKAAVVYTANAKNDTIEMGETFKLTNLKTKQISTFQLVGGSEASPKERKLSIDSPIGKAVNGQNYGDELEIELPNGKQKFIVEKGD